MSLKTWKNEFRPFELHDVLIEEAIKYSLLMWTGLRVENLKKHKIITDEFYSLKDKAGNRLYLEIPHCPLCIFYKSSCSLCPVSEADYTCDGDDERSAYSKWVYGLNPEPMISVLSNLKEQAHVTDYTDGRIPK